jgi:hypothetical protein
VKPDSLGETPNLVSERIPAKKTEVGPPERAVEAGTSAKELPEAPYWTHLPRYTWEFIFGGIPPELIKRLYLPVAVFAATWTILVVTAPGIPLGWDEQAYMDRAHYILDWSRHDFPFSQSVIRSYWVFINQAEGHPAGFAILIAIGQSLAAPFTDPLTAARIGPITLFSVACAAIAMRLKHDCGTAAAVAAPILLVTFPRMFSEAHFATQDAQLTAWWLLLWTAQWSFSATVRGDIGLGVVLGVTTATKFTGWLSWGPVIASRLIQRHPAAVQRLALVVLPAALVVFYVLNPPLWHDPVGGLREHFSRNVSRDTVADVPIMFLGRIYGMGHSLPWYNTLAWLVLVTPMPTLLLGMVGFWRSLARPTTWSATLLLHWATLMIVRALPGTPPHDGIRLFLPAFGFWCVLAAIGAQSVVTAIAAIPSTAARWVLRSALGAMLLSGAVTVSRYYPQTLSHYSLLAGGLRGAADKGMEAAYWWDGLDREVLLWLNNSTSPGESVAFSTIFDVTILKRWGRLDPPAVNPEQASFKWYVLQNRPGMFTTLDSTLVRREKPAYVKYAGRRRAGEHVPHDLAVPLIFIFSFEQYERARMTQTGR